MNLAAHPHLSTAEEGGHVFPQAQRVGLSESKRILSLAGTIYRYKGLDLVELTLGFLGGALAEFSRTSTFLRSILAFLDASRIKQYPDPAIALLTLGVQLRLEELSHIVLR